MIRLTEKRQDGETENCLKISTLKVFGPEVAHISSSHISFFISLVRKSSPELTSVTHPSLFAEEDWPWANICAHLPLFCMWDATTAWFDKQCVGPCPGSKPANLGPPK